MSGFFAVSDAWKAAYPGAAAGLLVMENVANPPAHPELERHKAELEGRLRDRYGRSSRSELLALPSLQPYAEYYRRFGKTYHVQLQLESVALKGKSLPRRAALVEAMFMAELENQMLTAGHDARAVEAPIHVDVAPESESYVTLSGKTQALEPGDMLMRDARGVISAVLHGPDQRTQIRPDTERVMFAVYAPAGIGAARVEEHLRTIAANVRIVAPSASVVSVEVYSA
jgi:DNA/RNA-binding domain of Phe-tRNA-synthetase-like protein